MEIFDVIIIGGGAAGLFAAVHSNSKTLLLEKKSCAGNKLMLSGQGRCNFTHSGPISEFYSHYGKNGDFIKHALKRYTNKNLIDFFTKKGLQIVEDKNGKLFPKSGNAADILDLLSGLIKQNRHTLRFSQPVISVTYQLNLFHVVTKTNEYRAKKIIVATGGLSYPSTGSTGDGYSFAKWFGHTIVSTRPSLSPVFVKNYKLKELAGISIKNCEYGLYKKDKKIGVLSGDIGFTHKGLSGPGILNHSRDMEVNDVLKLNFCGISKDRFNQLFLDMVRMEGKSTLQQFLRQFDLPKNLLRLLLSEILLEPAEKIGNINKEQRNKLIATFCEYPQEIEKIGGYGIAMATAGGVSLKEVNPKTIESKLQPGLFFAGEVLDIDGDTGGYNLQAAFSTAYCALING